ncbi:hypothetical protein [Dehalobacter sp. TBBPA1]|uniref:hypothetical protein n=1 Tax=Dehalobacter sp. TBBPA1 TaxID=3235037 RepID=UPI0034A210BE
MINYSAKAYQIQIYFHPEDDKMKICWDAQKFFDVLNSIGISNIYENTDDKWFLYIHEFKEDKSFIWGSFKGAYYGETRNLLDRKTLKERSKWKTPTEGVKQEVHFVIRKKDGYCLIEHFPHCEFGSNRIMMYFSEKTSLVREVSFEKLITSGFIEHIEKMPKIASLQVRLRVKNIIDGQSQSTDSLQRSIDDTEAEYLTLRLSGKRGKSGGLAKRAVKTFLEPFISDRKLLVSARAEGTKNGYRSIISLDGFQEKYDLKSITDVSIFEEMKEIINNRSLI